MLPKPVTGQIVRHENYDGNLIVNAVSEDGGTVDLVSMSDPTFTLRNVHAWGFFSPKASTSVRVQTKELCESCLWLQPQLRSNLVQVGHGQRSGATNFDVIVSVECLEDFGRAVTARYVEDLVCREFAPRRQFLAIRF